MIYSFISIKNQLFYQTFFAWILALWITILGIIRLTFFSQEFFKKNSPSVNLSSDSLRSPPKLNYFNDFEFLLGIQNSDYKTEINERIFNAQGILFKIIVNEPGIYNIKSNIDLTSCDKALLNNKNLELYSDINLKGFYCISNNQEEEIYINEHWGKNGFSMKQIKFKDCDNDIGNCDS